MTKAKRLKNKKNVKRQTLREYYKTKHWKDLYFKYSLVDDAHCEICGARRYGIYKRGPKKGQRKPKAEHHLHLHHKHYDNMLNEDRSDLMLLCDSCHKLGHQLQKMSNKNEMYKKMYADFKKKTGWDYKKRRK